MDLAKATTDPGEGVWEILVDRWWSVHPDKGLVFYSKSPQCHRNAEIAKMLRDKYYPDAQVIFIPRVYLGHDCSDYY